MTARKIYRAVAYGLRGKKHDHERHVMWCSPPGWLFSDHTTIDFPNTITRKVLKVYKLNGLAEGKRWNTEDWAWNTPPNPSKQKPPLMEGWIND